MDPTTEATRLIDSPTTVQQNNSLLAFLKFMEELVQTTFNLWIFRSVIDTLSADIGVQVLTRTNNSEYNLDEATRIAYGGACITTIGYAMTQVIARRQYPAQFGIFQRATTCDSVGGLAYYTVGSMSLSLLGAMICWSIHDLLGNAKMDLGEMLASSAVGNAVLFVPLVIAFHLILKGSQHCKARKEPIVHSEARQFTP